MRILTLIPMWKRPDVVRVMLINLTETRKKIRHSMFVLAIICPHDPDKKELETLCREHGVNICYFQNIPLGRKMNAGINYAINNFEFDYLMNFGSDDLIHPTIFDLYKPYFEQKTLVFGINSLYFYEFETQKTIFFRCYTDGLVVGAGRMIHKSVFEMLKQNKMDLYEDEINRSMDSNSSGRLKNWLGIYDTVIDSGEFPYIVDIKTNTNINHITYVEQNTQQIKIVDKSVITKYFKL